jgi:hypothetical protein
MNSDIRDFLLKLNGDYKDLLPEFAERYVGRLALGGELPKVELPTVKSIIGLGSEPQRDIPYIV